MHGYALARFVPTPSPTILPPPSPQQLQQRKLVEVAGHRPRGPLTIPMADRCQPSPVTNKVNEGEEAVHPLSQGELTWDTI
jgi:hypothetical protein